MADRTAGPSSNRWTLRIIAALLAGHLALAAIESDSAQPATAHASSTPQGIPNAGLQRKQMLEKLDQLVDRNEQLISLLKSGKIEVAVSNIEELQTGD